MIVSGVIQSVSSISKYDDDLELLEVTVGDFDTYKMFGLMNDVVSFVGKDVQFTARKDIINGIPEYVICDITTKNVIDVVDLDGLNEDIDSLIVNRETYSSFIDFDSSSLKVGDVALAKTVLVCSVKNGKSKKSKWKDFTCIDSANRAFSLRLFSNMDQDVLDDACDTFVGNYVIVDIQNTFYGLQVSGSMDLIEGEQVKVPPEVTLAALGLSTSLYADNELKEYADKYDLISKLKSVIHYEIGYHLVEMYSELMLIKTCCKIYDKYNYNLLRRAVFATRGYLLGNSTGLSNIITNYHRLLTSSLKNDRELIKLIDFASPAEEGDLNKELYLSVRRQVTSIMKDRRGLNEKNSISCVINDIDESYSGLFKKGLGELD